MTDQITTPSDVPAWTTARRQIQALGLTEPQAVAVLLPVMAEVYREVAEDAAEGAHGGTWGETVPEALTAFADAYRELAADCDLPGAPLPEVTHALERERTEHEAHRSAVCKALGRHMGLDWRHAIERVETVATAAKERADLLEEARDALEAAGQNGPHGDDWPAVAPAIRALAADRDCLATELRALKATLAEKNR